MTFLMNQSYRVFLVSIVHSHSPKNNVLTWWMDLSSWTHHHGLRKWKSWGLVSSSRSGDWEEEPGSKATDNFATEDTQATCKTYCHSQIFCLGKCQRKRGIVKKFPNIGKAIEDFVSERNVGADFWRRTGVLTFDRNQNVKEKVTYERIRQHLQKLYDHSFSYGTVVQLCVARNKGERVQPTIVVWQE